MKKTIILLLSFMVLGCFVSYYQAERARKAEALLWAAYEGNLIEVKNLLEEGAEADYALYITDKSRHYQNALFTLPLAAASGGNEKILQYLVKNKLQIHSANDKNWTPLFIAVRDGHAEFAAQLIENEADINAQTDIGTTPLMLAFLTEFPDEKQRLSLIEYMLKKGANPNLQTQFNTDVLFYAVTELKDLAGVKLLLEHKADVCRLYNDKKLFELTKDKKMRSLLKKAHKEQCKN